MVKQIEDSYEARDKKNDPLPQEGMRAAKEVHTGAGSTRHKGRKFMCIRSGKTGNSTIGRPG